MLTNTDQSEILDTLRSYGFPDIDIQTVIDGIAAGHHSLSDVADLVDALETGDDDDAFMCAAFLGLA